MSVIITQAGMFSQVCSLHSGFKAAAAAGENKIHFTVRCVYSRLLLRGLSSTTVPIRLLLLIITWKLC